MLESVTATTITLAEKGDIGLGNWVWLCVGIMLLAVIIFVISVIVDDAGFAAVSGAVGVVAFFAWLILLGIQDTRTVDDLVNRQEAALQEQLEYSSVEVTDEGDFVAADSDGQLVSGILVEKDGVEYYVIIDDTN